MVATVPTQHPFPVASGGLRHSQAFRPLRGPPSQYVRQPDLGMAPAVVSIAGFASGSGAGAFIANDGGEADLSQGLVKIRVGLTPASAGTIVLQFPIPPTAGQYVAFADWASIVVSETGFNLTLAWTATRPLIPNETLTLAYQWTVSQ
jgi:hypothetical protein